MSGRLGLTRSQLVTLGAVHGAFVAVKPSDPASEAAAYHQGVTDALAFVLADAPTGDADLAKLTSARFAQAYGTTEADEVRAGRYADPLRDFPDAARRFDPTDKQRGFLVELRDELREAEAEDYLDVVYGYGIVDALSFVWAGAPQQAGELYGATMSQFAELCRQADL